MKRFLSAGEGYVPNSLTYKLLSPFKRYIQTSLRYIYGWLAYPLWVTKVTGIAFLGALFKPSTSCNFSFLRTSCIYLGLFFMCLQAAIANQPDPVTDRAAQVANDPKTYQIGDKLPKDFVIGYDPFDSLKTIKLSDFKGKAVILDAWATWCGSCISKFPVLDSLSKVYGDRFQVLLVGMLDRDNPETISRFVADYLEVHPDFSLTFVIEQPRLNASFAFRSLPHYIWIDPNRRVRAFTGTDAFQDGLIRRLLMGMPIYTPVKLR